MKTLLFFTATYPYGKGETFIENEIVYLAREFDKVYIFPAGAKGQKRLMPGNIEVVEGLFTDRNYSRNRILKKYPFQISGMFFSELIHHGKYINDKIKLFSSCLRMAHKASLVEEWLKLHKIDNGVFYTYWMHDWTTILSVLRSKKIINHLVTRAHRFDLYEYRQENGFIPFRPYQLKLIDKVFLISNEGLQYLKEKYPDYRDKMILSYLGTTDSGINSMQNANKIHLVSISNIIPVKRVQLIVEILKNVKQSIQWTHFGDGVLMDKIVEQSNRLPKNIGVDFKGRLPNSEVLKFLKGTPISFFINVSESEGLPVSIMEAISFGIPVIATDVGGTSEIVKDKTGVLIESDFDPENVVIILSNFFSSKYATQVFRNGARDFWENDFDANKNYPDFIKQFVSLSN